MIKKNVFSKRGDVLITLLAFFMFFTNMSYASKIKSSALKNIHFVNITTPVAATASSSAAAATTTATNASAVAVTMSVVEEETPADADDEKEDEAKPVTHSSAKSDVASTSSSSAPAVALTDESDAELGNATSKMKALDIHQKGKEESKRTHKPRKYRDRLILGEADFSFTLALIKKHAKSHPSLPKYIIATELSSLENLARGYPHTFFKNMANLSELNMVYQGQILPSESGKKLDFDDWFRKWHNGYGLWNDYGLYSISCGDGGMISTGIDATKLDEIFPKHIKGQRGFRFERIHFNFPMTSPASEQGYDYKNTKKLMKDFFQSASKIQLPGDRIHITIPGGHWREDKHYDIYNASLKAHYNLIKKHRFKNRSYLSKSEKADERYPGYEHNQDVGVYSRGDGTAEAIRNAIEFVFEKARPETLVAWQADIPVDDDSSDYLDDADGDWYSGEMINALIDYYFGQAANAVRTDTQDLGLGRMHAINVRALDGDVFRHNLAQREAAIRAAVDRGEAAVPQLLIPVNIGAGEGNHWAGLYICRVPDTDGAINIFYFDPIGNPMPSILQSILTEIYGEEGRRIVHFYQNNHQYQEDGYNCGPWVIEFFRNFVPLVTPLVAGEEVGPLFPAGFNIEAARTNHGLVLAPRPNVVEAVATAPAAVPLHPSTISSAVADSVLFK